MAEPLVALRFEPGREVLQHLSCKTLYPFVIKAVGAHVARRSRPDRVWSRLRTCAWVKYRDLV